MFAISYFCRSTFSVLELEFHLMHTICSSLIIVSRKVFASLKRDIALVRLQLIKTEL